MFCSSFSKDISRGLRVGWVAPGRFKSKVEWLKFTANGATATLPQMAVAEFLASGGYDRHLRHIRRESARNLNLFSQAVTRYFPPETRVTRPTGGSVLWLQLPENVDSLELYKLALQNNITIAPGYLFSATNQYANFVRLNAVAWSYPIERAVDRLGNMISSLAKEASLGISVKKPHMVVKQRACNLPGRDKCAGRGVSGWSFHRSVA